MIADYLVSYVNGSGGTMLTALIKQTVLGIRASMSNIRSSSQYNDAHNTGGPHNFKIINNKNERDLLGTFTSIVRKRPGEPVFIPTHVYWPDIQFQHWPNARLTTVLHTEADLLELSINGFYKTELNDQWLQEHPSMSINWYNKGNVIFNSLRNKRPSQLTNEELSIAVRARMGMVISTGYHMIKPIDDPRMFYIQYRELMDCPDRVMSLIEQVTGIQPPESVLEELISYQSRQREFMSAKRTELGL
jgi:hypothetical protein